MKKDKLPLEFVQKVKNSIKNINLKTEYKKITKNGEIRWLQSSIMPIYDDNIQIGEVIVNYDITDKKTLQKLAITDELTGLYNRRYFNEMIDREINRANRTKSFLSFLVLDVDYFKKYNDTYGHDAGDKALSAVATAIKNSIKRGSDFAFRLGGEEFGVIFSKCEKERSFSFAEKIRRNIESLNIPHSNSKTAKNITVSIGLIVVDFRDEHVDKNGFYAMADDALYRAKKQGRNKVVLHKNNDLEFF